MKYFISFLSPLLYLLIIVFWNFIKSVIWDNCCLELGIYSKNITRLVYIIDTALIYIFYIGILFTVILLLVKKKWRYALLFVVGSIVAYFLFIFTMMYSQGDLCQTTPESYDLYREELLIKCLGVK